MIKIKNNNSDPKIQMTINMGKGFILAGFVVLNSVYLHLNSYVFLIIFVLLIAVIVLVSKFLRKKFMY